MARPSKLAAMSVEALLQLRDDIGNILDAESWPTTKSACRLGDGGWISSGKKAVLSAVPEEAR